ncbi:MAG TPA: hypothetical protein VMI32_11180 [Candidatus Solibacter sp.]|nr:hypothetical protein [Candidatus Solibacter sp.]
MHLTTMRARSLLFAAGLIPAFVASALTQNSAQPPAPPRTEAEKSALLDRVIANEKQSDEAMYSFERIERVESFKKPGDPRTEEIKVSRVIPAGTGLDHIPIGPDGKPTDPGAYHEELVKLERTLSWAADDGHAQREAYEKVAKRQKEREELVDATRTAFLYTLVSTETRAGRILFKYSMAPNPAFKPTSRATSIFEKVHGFVWIDPEAGQIARVEGEVSEDISIGLFLAKIYKGSHFMQERYEVLPGVWMPTYSQYDFDGRRFFSTISVHERTFYSQYHRIGPPKEALAIIRAELSKPDASVSDP